MKEIIEVSEFLSELGVIMLDAENKLFEIRPNDGGYFDKNGHAGGYQMPLYFSAASLILKDATNILEIGTGHGTITNLLSHLFPTSIVYTIDIPISDKDYKDDCWRKKSEENLRCFERNISRDNIKFIEKNSFFLSSMGLSKQMDLIYVDGGHWHPIVDWDIMFAYNNIRPGGLVFFHDYSGDGTDVQKAIEYMRNLINEEIKIGPSCMPPKGGCVAWLRKQAKEEIK